MPTKVLNWNTAKPSTIDHIISGYLIEGKYDVVESMGMPTSAIDKLRSGYTGPNEYLSPLMNLIVQGEMDPPPAILNIPGDAYKITFRRGNPAIREWEDVNTIYSSGISVGRVTESEWQGAGRPAVYDYLVKLNSSFSTYSTAVSLNRICGLWDAYGGYRSEIMKFFFEPATRTFNTRIPLKASDFPGDEAAIEAAFNDKGIKRKTWHPLPYGERGFANQPFGRGIFHELTYGGFACGFPWERWLDFERSGIPWDDGAEYNAGNYDHYVAGKVILPSFIASASLNFLKYFRYWRIDQHGTIPGIIAANCNSPSFPGTPYISYDDDGNPIDDSCGAVPCVEFPDVRANPTTGYTRGAHPFDTDDNGEYLNKQKAIDYFIDICGHFDAIADWLEDGCPCEWIDYGSYSATDSETDSGVVNEYLVYKNKDKVDTNKQPTPGDKIVKYTTSLPDGKYFVEKMYFNDYGATTLKQVNYYITESLTDESQGFKGVFNLKLRNELVCLNDIKLPYTEAFSYHYSAPLGDELTAGVKQYNLFNNDEFTFNLIGNDKIELWLTDKREFDLSTLGENEFVWSSTVKIDPEDAGRTFLNTDPYLFQRKVMVKGLNDTHLTYELVYKDHDGAQTHFVKTGSLSQITQEQNDENYIKHYPIKVSKGVKPYEYKIKTLEDNYMVSNGGLEFDKVDGKLYGFAALAMTKKKYEIEAHDQLGDEVMRSTFTLEITPRLPEKSLITQKDLDNAIAQHVRTKHSGS